MPAASRPSASGGGDWRAALDGYLPRAQEEASGEGVTGRYTALALQFELRELIPRTVNRWNGPTSRAVPSSVKTLEAHVNYRLGARPVTRTAKGWARGALTWANLPHFLNRLDLDPAQHRWFNQFAALHRAAHPPVPGTDSGWVFLDEFVNPVLWVLLRQAGELGIPLVGTAAGEQVTVASEAAVALDASRDATGIRMEPALVVDGAAAAVTDARPIATHGIYLVRLEKPRHFVIAPTAHPLLPEELALLGAPGPVVVPPEAVDEFLADYLPELGASVELVSADASVALPEPLPPVLVLVVTHAPAHTIELAWHWQQRARAGTPPALADVLPPEWVPAEGAVPPAMTLRDLDAADFVLHALPRLRRLPGVRVESRGTAPKYRELTGDPHLAVSTVPSEKRDWFDLGVTVTVDGHTIPLLPLFKALAKGRKRLMLADGTAMPLTHRAFAPLAALIAEARDLDEWEVRPVISRHQTSLWADFEDLADEATPAVAWRALLAESGGDSPVPVDPPAGLRAELRHYQREGFSWLAFLWRHRLGGILADDMGLGKTIQCLALVQHVREQHPADRRPFLVVAPTSVVSNWAAEAARFTPGLVVREITTSKTPVRDAVAGADIVVTSYALLRLDFEAYQAVATSTGWAALILDEAQFVKNAAAKVHESARDLEVGVKVAVTGTPMENSLTELHALLQIVAPGLFASARRFGEEYVRPIEDPAAGITRGVGAGTGEATLAASRTERLARLRRRIRPFVLRRTKELVAPELPAKQEQTVMIELAPEHRELYDVWLQRERQKLFGLLEDLDRNRFIVFRSLTLLRLLALDASLIDEKYADVPSSKLDALFEQLDDVIAEGHRALVFSQFTSYLRRAAARLEAAGIPYVYLDGSTRKRGAVVEEFRNGDAPVFLISLKAGGFGLNLTDADYVFLLDPWWNPATEEQAIDRTHRIGQSSTVMVYRLIAAGTIEEKVMALKERKAALFDAVIDDEALFSEALSADDVRELFA